MAMIRPPRRSLLNPRKEDLVSIPTIDLYDALLRQQAADAVIGGLLRKPCPSDETGRLCYYCAVSLRADGHYVGHIEVVHEDDCPWKDVLAYAKAFIPKDFS